MTFQTRLVQARKAKKLSQEQFGIALGNVTKQAICNWEKGRNLPPVSELENICWVLGCSVEWLVTGESPAQLSPDALRLAAAYDAMPEEMRRKVRAALALFIDPEMSDSLRLSAGPAPSLPAPKPRLP